MIGWLLWHGEEYDEKATRKAELFEGIQRLKPPNKVYKTDQLLKEEGHTVLKLLPHVCDLNSIEFVWAKVKQHVRSKNTTGKASVKCPNIILHWCMSPLSWTFLLQRGSERYVASWDWPHGIDNLYLILLAYRLLLITFWKKDKYVLDRKTRDGF